MNKTLIFLLILSLSLSRTTGDRPNATFKHIIHHLKMFQNETINVTSNASHNLHRSDWTCNTAKVIFEELNAVLDKINGDGLSQTKSPALKGMKENLKIVIEKFSLQPVKAGKKCRSKWYPRYSKKPLEWYYSMLQCFNRSCIVTSKQS